MGCLQSSDVTALPETKNQALVRKCGSPQSAGSRDFVFLSHNLGRLPRRSENLNLGLGEQVKQKGKAASSF